MIVFVTTRHHAYTVRNLLDGSFGPPLPAVRHMAWDALLRADHLPQATYILTDLERLTPHERRMAADTYRAIRAAGLRCLNDPARIPTRHALLARLHAAGLNPFRAWRAEEGAPRPNRFPVFLRFEDGHEPPLSDLLPDQAALEAALAALQARGLPLAGVLVVEFCAEPVTPGAWRRYGTFRIGEAMHTDHSVIQDGWWVKAGTLGLSTEAMAEEEYRAARDGRYLPALRPVFELAGVEYGRADHATAEGREVVFEINTNPTLSGPHPQRLPRRAETLELSRWNLARALAAIDSGDGLPVPIEAAPAVRQWREHSFAAFMPWRP
jgi:hypothetical protein